jgi:hypothetical protein
LRRNQNGARVVPTRSGCARGKPFVNPNLPSHPVPLRLETSRAPGKSSPIVTMLEDSTEENSEIFSFAALRLCDFALKPWRDV